MGIILQFPKTVCSREKFLSQLRNELSKRDYAAFCCGIIDEVYYDQSPDYIIELIHEYYDICDAEEEADFYMEFGHGSPEEN